MTRREWAEDAETGLLPEIRATPFSGTLAVLVAVLAGLALGAADGSLRSVLGTAAGAIVASLGVRAAQSETNARRAVGSVCIVAGAAGFAGVALLGGGAVAPLVGAAVAAVTVNATISFDERVERPAVRAVWRSATVLAVGAVLGVLLYTGVFVALFRVGTDAVPVVASSALALLVVLQIELLLVVELVHVAVPVLDRWLPESRDLRAATVERFGFRAEDLPRAYWAVFALQVILALSSWGPRWFGAFLDSLSVFGDAVALLLFSGVLHVPLAALIGFLVSVLLARGLQAVFVAWAGSDPPQSVAHAAGGIVTLVAPALLAVAFPQTVDALAGLAGPDWAETVEAVGLTATVAGTMSATLFVVAAARRVLATAVAPWAITDSASGFAVSGGALFVASLVVADGGGSALAVFAGVAAALLVHDLGTHAVELGAQVGSEAETRAGEATHAVGSLLVGTGGVAFAGLTAFVMGSVPLTPPAWRARLAVALLLVAVLCFAVLFERGE
ncbi:hypothetical protein [Halorussus sp. MSC15.2]|uniref:DUF7519 family protein n=1 Tax=Halorussus sp. MSC15.2 TaxID=2283638 RepID=UPI0013D2F051|nr:hypothetical protein [Halorussus sp. MSC15.2]NEU58203.1 hypothetical protein [Halorussus sp. MSC15.2]